MCAVQIRNQEREWDPKGDGTITKGEFRQHIRALGVHGLGVVPVDEVDAMFEAWDDDNSGSIDMHELEIALKRLRAKWVARHSKQGLKPAVVMQIAALRARAEAGKQAAVATQRAEKCQEELRELNEVIEARIDVQLGRLIQRAQLVDLKPVATSRSISSGRPLPNGHLQTTAHPCVYAPCGRCSRIFASRILPPACCDPFGDDLSSSPKHQGG